MQKAWVLAVAALVTFAGCSGGGDDGGGTGPEPVFTSLTIEPSSPSVIVGGTTTLTATARDQSNNSMSGAQVTYTSGSEAIATVTNAGVVTGVAAGSALITATGVIGSVTKTAQVTVNVTAPSGSATVAATTGNQFSPKDVTITKGGTITWNFATAHNVTFDTPGAPSNIPTQSSGSASATFPNVTVKTTYSYHCTLHPPNMVGTVTVVP